MTTRALFSLVVPTYNVARYLPAFLDSLSAQRLPISQCEVIFVDDGSTDASGELIRSWIAEHDPAATLITQENGGLCAARNTGMAQATGAWISFPDPDDVLDPDYLHHVRNFIAHQEVEPDLVCTHAVFLDDATSDIADHHPLRFKFAAGDQVVNLEQFPEFIHLQAASAFIHLDVIRRLGLTFDSAIRPNFEDASFLALYLDDRDAPLLGIAADATYLYRRRADGSSLVQQSWANPHKYTTVLEHGYLKLLREIHQRRGSIPTWAQNTVLYDLLFYFRHEESAHGATGAAQPQWTERFHELAAEILSYIDTETIEGFSVMRTSFQLKSALIIGYHRERLVPVAVPLERVDADQQIVQIRYFFDGDLPREDFRVRGVAVEPVHSKIRDLTYLHRVLVRERILWLPATGTIRMWLNGQSAPLHLGRLPEPLYAARPEAIWRRLTARPVPVGPWPSTPGGGRAPEVAPPPGQLRRLSAEDRLKDAIRTYLPGTIPTLQRARRTINRRITGTVTVRPGPFDGLDPSGDGRLVRIARTAASRRRYASAWTFIDRDTEAHDNAEHLYRYVLQHQPQVNAWFVLRRESPDWDRLEREGFRLIPFGSQDHVVLLLNTDHLISSQADHYVVRPLDETRFGRRSWRFTFLQHGVTKDDLSRWLNSKPISRFITASVAEHESIAGDHTPYIYTTKEVRLTGFPRHDRLLELGRAVERPDLILVMPTWRRSLMDDAHSGNTRRLRARLHTTAFGQSWFGLLHSDELHTIAEQTGLEVVFMPHPNMQQYIGAEDVPDWVRTCTYSDTDVQELLARAAVTVTDYSSQAFEAAYLERPVVYYQFDRSEFYVGTHVYRQGTWNYDTSGFGPVAHDLDGVVGAIGDAARGKSDQIYGARMRDTFPFRDGRCCERTFASIRALTEPLSFEEAYLPAAPSHQPGPQNRSIEVS